MGKRFLFSVISMMLLFVVVSPSIAQTSIPKPPTRPFAYNCPTSGKDEAACLACNLFHEARGEDDYGMFLVGMVTFNRVRHDWFPDTFCETIYQVIRNSRGKWVAMFSWTNDDLTNIVYNRSRWSEVYRVAQMIIDASNDPRAQFFDPTKGALCYHSTGIKRPPTWRKEWELFRYGRHVFYSRC